MDFPWITRKHAISYHMENVMRCVTLHMDKIWRKRIKYPISHARSMPRMKCASPPRSRSTVNWIMTKNVAWVTITIKITIIPDGECPWLLIMLQALLTRYVYSAPTIFCNMTKLVTIVTLYLMHQRKEGALIPLKFNKYAIILSWSKRSSECWCSLRSSSLLLLDLLLITLLLPLLLFLLFTTSLLGSTMLFFPTCELDSPFWKPRPNISNDDLCFSSKISKATMLFSIFSCFLMEIT